MPEVWYTFPPKKILCLFLNAEPSHFVFLKTYNTEFGEVIITFTYENGRPLITLLINK